MLWVACVWLTKLKKKYIKNYVLGGLIIVFEGDKSIFFSSGPNISSHQPKYNNNKAKLNKMVDTLNITAKQPKKSQF